MMLAIACGGVGYIFRHSLFPADHAGTHVEAPAAVPMAVTVVTAGLSMMSRRVVAGGTLVARDEVLVTAQVTGVPILRVLVDVGAEVTEGQTLADLDGQRLALLLVQKAAEFAQSEAGIAQAAAISRETATAAEEALVALERARSLRQKGAISEQALEEKRTAHDGAVARVEAQDQAKGAARAERLRVAAERDELLWQQRELTVRATAGGLITERNAKPGQIGGADDSPLFRIVRGGEVEMEALVVETALPAIRIGQRATVTLPGDDRPVEGRVRLVSPAVDPATRMGKVWISLTGSALRPGSFASASFQTGEREAIVLPHAAVLVGDGGTRVPALQNVQSIASVVRPELRIVPRAADAAALGESPAEIASVLRIATLGDISQNLAKFSYDGRLIDIKVLLPHGARQDVALLETFLLRGSGGTIVPLAAVADIGLGAGPSSVKRLNRERQIVIEADLAPGADLGSALAAVMALEEVKSLPDGMNLAESGDAELMAEVFSSFFYAMGAGLMLVLILLILLYADLFQPITILLSLPLSMGGAMLALLMTGHGISLPVVIGIMMLIGIVTKNAILLVDFAIEEIRKGVPRREALIEAGLKRAKPIVMTTVAMSAGMLPAALAVGSGDGFRVPMAIAVIGGLVVSTALSLAFVPAVFTYLDDLKRILTRILGRFVTSRGEPASPQTHLKSAVGPARAAE